MLRVSKLLDGRLHAIAAVTRLCAGTCNACQIHIKLQASSCVRSCKDLYEACISLAESPDSP